jgi:hypothetical protein
MARNDIHCPTNFKPQDYDVLDHFGMVKMGEGEDWETYGEDAIDAYDDADTSANPHSDLNQCDLCGQRFVHGAVLTHKDGDVISVGGICMSGIAGIPALSDGQKLNAAKRALRKRERFGKLRQLIRSNPGLNAALKTDHYISKDLRASANEWGNLSEKQVDLAFKIQKDVSNTTPEAPAGPVPVTDKRIRIQGTILGTKVQDTAYGQTEKMLFSMDLGDGTACKLWGTLPQAVSDHQWAIQNETGEWPNTKGLTLSFMAKVQPSNDDENFGFINRPTKVEVA